MTGSIEQHPSCTHLLTPSNIRSSNTAVLTIPRKASPAPSSTESPHANAVLPVVADGRGGLLRNVGGCFQFEAS